MPDREAGPCRRAQTTCLPREAVIAQYVAAFACGKFYCCEGVPAMVRAGFLIVLSLFATAATAQTQLPAHGGPGGRPFATACPALHYLRGLELRTADDVDAARPICGRIGTNDKLAGEVSVGPWRGGTGGVPQSIMCPSVRPMVVGFRIGAEGRNTYIVNSIELFCARPDDSARPTPADVGDVAFHGEPLPTDAYKSGIIAKFFIAPSFKMTACPAGQVGGGIHGQHGIWLDKLA
jgi:hypothetical protein